MYDCFSPLPIPPFDGVTEATSSIKTTWFGIVGMKFKKLHKVMVVITRKNNIGNFIGLSFFDTANVCLATAMFQSPIT